MKTLSQILNNDKLPRLYENLDNKNKTVKAQQALNGRTHYVEPSSLKFHRSRILSALPVTGGAFYKIIESTSLDYDHTKRGFRAVVFDLFGTVVYRPDLEECFSDKVKADKAFYKWFETFNEEEHYHRAITDKLKELKEEQTQIAEVLQEIERK